MNSLTGISAEYAATIQTLRESVTELRDECGESAWRQDLAREAYGLALEIRNTIPTVPGDYPERPAHLAALAEIERALLAFL